MNDPQNTSKKLRDHLFDQMQRLTDPDANLEIELKRATALAKVGTVIVNSAKQEIEAMKLMQREGPSKKKPAAKQIQMKPVKGKAKQIGNG
jgi:hypothetical protein